MYKTLIQLALILMLILIILFISRKYFYTEYKIDEVGNTKSLSTEKNDLLNKSFGRENLDNEIINLTYEKFDSNGNKYFIKAKKGVLDNKRPNIVYLSTVEASLIYLNNDKLTINSKEAIFNKETFNTTFSKNIKLIYQEQILESNNLEFLINKNIAIFKDNVKYYSSEVEAFGETVTINLLTKEIDIKSKNQEKVKIKTKN